MELCENVRGCRWQGSTAALRAGIGVLLLGFGLAQSVSPPIACPAPEAPQTLTQPEYHNTTKVDSSGFMASLTQSFLHTVQPNPFPQDLILKIVDDFNQQQFNQDTIKEILVYEVGFLVCVVIGALYIILMPIVGLCLACCRCCGNCGGKMYQKQTSSVHCRRRTLYWSAFVITGFILAGNICMFKSNDVLKQRVDQSPMELNDTIDNLKTFLTTVHEHVDDVVSEGFKTIDEVTRNLDAIGPKLGKEIQKRLHETLEPAIQSVQLLDQETTNTSAQLNNLNSSLTRLQSNLDLLQANVTAVKKRITQISSEPDCLGCDALTSELHQLTLDTSISTSGLNDIQSALDEVIKTNISATIKELEDYFNSIPQTVTNDTKDVVHRSKELLLDVKRQIAQVTKDIPLSSLTDMSETLGQVQAEINMLAPEVEKVNSIRLGLCLILCFAVLLVVVCNLLGLILGPLGLKSRVDPKQRSCVSDCGGTFLLMGTGFSFIFSWLFMIVVLLLFVVGGNVYSLVCRPWSNGQLLKFIETSNLFPELEIGPALGLDTNISISEFYSDCESNQPLWSALHLYEVINLEDRLNVSKYTEQIQQLFDETDITVPTITLMSPEVKNQLMELSTVAKDMNSTTILQQINNISSINLNTTAGNLDVFAVTQPILDIQTRLQNEAKDLRRIQSDIETTLTPQLENLKSAIKSLHSTIEAITGTVGETLSNVDAAQDFLDTNTTLIVKTESMEFVDCQLGYFTVYADWAYLSITQQVGRCGPMAGAVDTAEAIACSYVVGPLNGFWFSLGWCIIFFIPSIIFSTKLAKYYRKMKHSDANDDLIIMNQIPRAKFT